MLPSLFAALDAMREIDLSAWPGWGGWGGRGTAPFASWRDFLLDVDRDSPDQRSHGWRAKLVASPVGDDLFRTGYAALGDLAASVSAPRTLVHGDLVNRNVVVADGRVAGLFDWGCSLYGDFLYDIAWIEFWSPWHEGCASVDVRRAALRHYDEIGLGVPQRETRMRCCMLHIGLAHLAYCAHTGALRDLVAVAERTAPLV